MDHTDVVREAGRRSGRSGRWVADALLVDYPPPCGHGAPVAQPAHDRGEGLGVLDPEFGEHLRISHRPILVAPWRVGTFVHVGPLPWVRPGPGLFAQRRAHLFVHRSYGLSDHTPSANLVS